MIFWWYQWRWQSLQAFGLRSSYWKTSQTFRAPSKTALITSTANSESPKNRLKNSAFAVSEPSLFSPLICAGRLIFSSIWTKKKRHQFIFSNTNKTQWENQARRKLQAFQSPIVGKYAGKTFIKWNECKEYIQECRLVRNACARICIIPAGWWNISY